MSCRRDRALAAVLINAALVAACSTDPQTEKVVRVEAGDAHFEEQRFREAAVEYQNAIQFDEAYGEAHFKLGRALERTNQPDLALKHYIRAADLMPGDIDAQNAAARALILAGRFEDARARAEQATQRGPRSARAQILLGSALVGLRDLDQALDAITEAIALDPLDPQAHASAGVLHLARGEAQLAEAAFVEAVRLDPRSIETHMSLARFYWLIGKLGNVEQTLNEALVIDPRNREIRRALSSLYMRSGRAPEAEPHLKAIAAEANDASSQLALADYYMYTRRWSEATALLKTLEQDPEAAADAAGGLARVAYENRRTTEAHRIVDELIERGVRTAFAHLLKGRFLLAENRLDAAIDHLRAAVAQDPKAASGYYLLGNAYYTKGNLPEAAEALRKVLALAPGAVAAHLQLSRVSLLRGDAEGALQAAENALTQQPGNPVARVMLTDALMAKRDIGRAEIEIREMKRDYPTHAAVHAIEGKLQFLQGKYAAASRAFTLALDTDRTMTEAAVGLINIDLAVGETARARRRVELLLGQTPDDLSVQMLAARVYGAAQDTKRAEAVLRRTLELVPDNVSAHGMLGELYLREGRFPEALTHFEALAAREPRSVTALTMLGIALQAQRRMDAAAQRYEQALEIDANAATASNNLAWILVDTSVDLDRALRLAQRAVELRPNDAEFNDTLGWAYYRQQLPTLAVEPLERATQLRPNNPIFYYHLGLAHAAAGNSSKARSALQRALSLRPDFEGSGEAKSVLAGLTE